MSGGCIFCKIVSGEIPAQIVRSDGDVVAFRDVNPQAPVHVLCVPRRHAGTLDDLNESDVELAGKLLLAGREVARSEGLAGRGYRLVLNCGAGAGQSVFHVHLHVLGGRSFSWPPG